MLKQLSGLDAMFLYSENRRMPLEVSSLHIYDPSTAPNGKVRFKEILATFDNRVEHAGIFHRKVLELPFSLDHPYWVEDEHFDIEYHVRHIALPEPGDWRQLMIQVSRLQSRELDRSRPLWEVYVIEGLDNVAGLKKGCFALLMKMHHATVDGMAGAALQAVIHDSKPVQTDAADYEPGIRSYADSAPNMATLLAKSPISNLQKSAKLILGLGKAVPRLLKAKLETWDDEGIVVPPTLFSREAVSANRVIEGRLFNLDDFKAIAKTVPNAKVNDVALSVVSGALRKYLASRDDLPAESLVAGCPVNIRSEESEDADNMVSMMSAPLCTDIRGPKKRLRTIVQETRKTKDFTEALGADTLLTVPMYLPAFLARNLSRSFMDFMLRFDATSCNTIVSNVPGNLKPLYFCGARMLAVYGIGPIVDQVGLFHAVLSYDGTITITFTSCRKMLPDPQYYAECLQSSFEELKTATLGAS